MMFRLSAILLFSAYLFFPLGSSRANDEIHLSLPKVGAPQGAEAEVPITVGNARQLGCLQLALLYDPNVIEVTRVTSGPMLPAKALFDHDRTIAGRLGLGFLSGPDSNRKALTQISGDGVVFNVRFKVVGRAGERSPLKPHRTQAWQVTDEKLRVGAQEGEFVVTGAQFPWLYALLSLLGLVILVVIARRLRRSPEQGETNRVP